MRADPYRGEIETPPSLHRYLYAYGNPTVYWDPDGHAPIISDVARFLNNRADDQRHAMRTMQRDHGSTLTTRSLAAVSGIGGNLLSAAGGIVNMVDLAADMHIATVPLLNRTSVGQESTARVQAFQQTTRDVAIGTVNYLAQDDLRAALHRDASLAAAGTGNYLSRVFVEGDLTAVSSWSGGMFDVAAGGAVARAASIGRGGSAASGNTRLVSESHSRPGVEGVVPNTARSEIISEANARSAYLKGKYGTLTSEQRLARIDELAMGNRVLREAGVPRQYISEALQSFEPGTTTHRIAGQNDFGLRLYGGASGPKSPYVGPTFPLGDVRSLNAVIPENTLDNIIQWQIRPGTPLLEGRIRANFGQPGGGQQIYVPDFHNNLLVPGRL